MTFIVAIGGKKGSGKTSLSCYLSAIIDDIVSNDSKNINNFSQREDKPRSVVLDSEGSLSEYDFKRSVDNGIVRTYSFADALKQFLMSSFGVSYHQIYGSDNEKNEKTKYKWDTLPSFTRWINSPLKSLSMNRGSNEIIFAKKEFINSITIEDDFLKAICRGWVPGGLRTGNVTARELMQVFGTDIGRKLFDNNIWVNATLSKIREDSPRVAIIDDLRFCSEAEAILGANGSIVFLSRNHESSDIHGSEKDLENFNIKSDKIYYIDNERGINDKNRECMSLLLSSIRSEVSVDFSEQI